MADLAEDDLIVELTKAVVAQTAPQELPILPATARAFFKDPDAASRPGKQRDDMLGFGVDSLTLITPTVLAVATAVVRFLVDEVAKSVKAEGAGVIRAMVHRLFRRDETEDSENLPAKPELSREQLAEIRQLAFEKASELRLPPDQAGMLADSMVGSLVLAA